MLLKDLDVDHLWLKLNRCPFQLFTSMNLKANQYFPSAHCYVFSGSQIPLGSVLFPAGSCFQTRCTLPVQHLTVNRQS